MAIKIELYKFSKKNNSTKQPGDSDLSIDCVLFEPCSIVSPQIIIVHDNPTAYNYCRIKHFNRYYFINNWTYNAGRWIADCNCDVLASWKSYIAAESQYIVRSSSEYDGNILDTFYPAKTNPSRVISNMSGPETGNPFTHILNNGIYVIGIINSDSGAVGAVSHYMMTHSQFSTLVQVLMGVDSPVTNLIEEISTELAKGIINPFDYIASCKWFPVDSFANGGTVSDLPYGWWSLPGVSAKRISSNSMRITGGTFDVPKHPQSGRGNYLNSATYCRHVLHWPCFGSFPLNADALMDSNYLSAQVSVDPISGGGTLQIFSSSGITLHTSQTSIGVDIQIAQIATDFVGFASNFAGALGGISNPLTLPSAISSIGNAINTAFPEVASIGKNGMISGYAFPPSLQSTFYHIVDEDNEHYGRPLAKKRIIGTLSGYVECDNAEITIPGTDNENSQIVSFMNDGFFYE